MAIVLVAVEIAVTVPARSTVCPSSAFLTPTLRHLPDASADVLPSVLPRAIPLNTARKVGRKRRAGRERATDLAALPRLKSGSRRSNGALVGVVGLGTICGSRVIGVVEHLGECLSLLVAVGEVDPLAVAFVNRASAHAESEKRGRSEDGDVHFDGRQDGGR